MKRFGKWIKGIFAPPADASTLTHILPYAIIIFLMLAVMVVGTKTWEYTNTTGFCGTTCHTMPPQYVTHQFSDHARVTCEDCHLGRTDLATQIVRKIQYSYQTGSATITNSYHLPIFAKNMRPARDVCETCHYPQTFSSDKLVEKKQFAQDENNTPSSTYLILKTGGGSQREGLGFGIHWHIENPVYFLATDQEQQEIPYVRVENLDGSLTEYVDIEADFNRGLLNENELIKMDCMTCHNRIAHGIENPTDAINSMLARGEISASIPYIRNQAGTVLRGQYESMDSAREGIYHILNNYQKNFPQEYLDYQPQIEAAAASLWAYYQNAVFMDQKMDWTTHPDNSQHLDSPGCFRCHDGKHLTTQNDTIRLECNICHSIPVISGAQDFVTQIEVSSGVEPDSHANSNWIGLHRDVFDPSCALCHTVEDPGGVSDTSFCSNSGCHGQKWEFAGLDAPRLRQILSAIKPTPIAPAALPGSAQEVQSYADIASIFTQCLVCHGDGAILGINLSSYDSIMRGDQKGAIVIPGDAAASPIIQTQSGSQPHFGQFSPQELEMLKAWINKGAKK